MRILYVEDDARAADLTMRLLERTAPQLQFETVSNIHDALIRLGRLDSEPLDLVLIGFGDDLSLVSHIRENSLPVAVVVVTSDEETVVDAHEARADDYVVKRKDYLERLPLVLESALNRAELRRRKEVEESLRKALVEVQELKDRLHEENIYLQEEIRVASNFGELIGASEALTRVLHQAEQVAPINTTVLLLGETGTGKELLAHAIHNLSPRHDRALVKLSCAALPAQLIESELFGHEKGAFTGASTQRIGRFELADGGTIFLDEVGELPLELQVKLLRVLEESQFEALGSSKTVRVDVRVIAATNRNLEAAVHRGNFRADLYYRLNIFPITLPPLRERMEDIPMLAAHILKQVCVKLGKKVETIPGTTMSAFMEYSWPGNIRELRNVIERAAIISQDSKLHLVDSLESPSIVFEAPARFPVSVAVETLEESEYNLIVRTLKRVHWRLEGQGGAAELLNVNPSTLRSRMKKLGISRPRVRSASN